MLLFHLHHCPKRENQVRLGKNRTLLRKRTVSFVELYRTGPRREHRLATVHSERERTVDWEPESRFDRWLDDLAEAHGPVLLKRHEQRIDRAGGQLH